MPVPDNMTIGLGSTNSNEDIAFMNAEGFLTPDSLYMVNAAELTVEQVKSIPDRFDTEGLIVEQHDDVQRISAMNVVTREW